MSPKELVKMMALQRMKHRARCAACMGRPKSSPLGPVKVVHGADGMTLIFGGGADDHDEAIQQALKDKAGKPILN